MKINKLNISTVTMPQARTTKPFSVNGSIGAEFEIIVLQNPSSSSSHTLYYDWKDKTFEAGHNDLNNNLKVKLTSSTYNNSITFAEGASGGGEYVVKLIAINGTTLPNANKNVISKTLSKQTADSVITFALDSINNSNKYLTQPSKSLTGAVGSSATLSFSLTAENSRDDSHSNGFFLKESSISSVAGAEKQIYHKATGTVDGAITDSTEVKVDSLTGIGVGSQLISISSGTLNGQPYVTAIDTATKTLTFATHAQTFSNDITLNFKALGTSAIFNATGLQLSSVSFSASIVDRVTTTVRTAPSSSTTINVGNTRGIRAGVGYSGLNVDNGSSNLVTAVTTPDPADANGALDNDGVITVERAQTLTIGTVLSFGDGSGGPEDVFKSALFEGSLGITTIPSSNVNLYLDLDQILTPGSAS